MSSAIERLDEQTMIPDLLRAAPQVRPVLDRYGLRGCGGPEGPVESLHFFARAHDVPLGRLLEEVRAAARRDDSPPTPRVNNEEHLADTIYRPFFKAGIAVVLTLGAAWGAYLLLRIAFTGLFTAAGLHEVNAHGHAQIFGWVGLFVMGFAYQAFPRFKPAALAWPRLARWTLWLMVVGLVVRSVCEPLAGTLPWLGVAAVAASALEVVAIGLFAAVVVRTWRTAATGLALYDYYVLSALGWFVAQAVYETIYLAATLRAADPSGLVDLVATWQAPLRDLQIHGFALLMILGVSQRLLSHFYGFPPPSQRVGAAALACLNAAVLGEALGLVLMHLSGHAWAALWYGSVLLLGGTVAALVWDWRLFGGCPEGDRSLKFLRTAYAWLLVSLAMLAFLPAYQHGLLPRLSPSSEAARIGFSHAYYGAVRHAITVGFVSLMIVGVAAKVVPTLNGLDVRTLPRLWLPFVLINTGCALRVASQTLTDFTPHAFAAAGVSGVLEVVGLALWGAHLWRIMAGRAYPAGPPADARPLAPDAAVEAGHLVGEVLDRDPELLETFRSFGFHPLANPLLRRTLARRVTIAGACRLLGVDQGRLLDALNARRKRRPRALALPVVAENGKTPPTRGAKVCNPPKSS
jgi:hypothetical protein